MQKNSAPPLTALAASLPASVPFVGPETQERARGSAFAARLGANENGFGPSPAAIKAMQAATGDIWMYADPESYDLREALAKHHDIAPECIMVGEGIDGLLGYLARLYVEPGVSVVTSQGAYPTFNYHAEGYGGTLHKVPYTDDHEDPKALLAAARDQKARLIYFANPDNPMGTWHGAKIVDDMIDALPEGTLLALDEAYIEFAPQNTAPAFDTTNPAVVRFRTFSKAYGMAGARVGYAVSTPENIANFHRIRNHFGMNRTAQIGAKAALADHAHLNKTLKRVSESCQLIHEIAEDNGLKSLPTATNFVAIDCGSDGDFARRVLAETVAAGVFVRMPFIPPQDRCIRVSAGPKNALSLFAEALPRALQIARN